MAIMDVHTHGIGGYDTRSDDVDHILRIAELHGSYGVDEIVLTVYPAPIAVMRRNLEVISRALELQKAGPVAERTELSREKFGEAGDHGPARIAGVHLEGPFLNPSKCGSLNAMVLIDPSEQSFGELIEGFEKIVRIVTIAPEVPGALALIRHMADRGIVVSLGHSDATYAEAEKGLRAGARGITHLFNAMRPFHHREPGIVGFGLTNPDIYVEVIADPYHLHDETIDLIFRVKPRDRIVIVSDSVQGSKMAQALGPDGITDRHGRLQGGAVTITEAAASLFDRFGEDTILDCISANPARYLS